MVTLGIDIDVMGSGDDLGFGLGCAETAVLVNVLLRGIDESISKVVDAGADLVINVLGACLVRGVVVRRERELIACILEHA